MMTRMELSEPMQQQIITTLSVAIDNEGGKDLHV